MSGYQFEPAKRPDVLAQACEVVAHLPPLPDAPTGGGTKEEPIFRGWRMHFLDGDEGPRDRFCVVLGDRLFELLDDLDFGQVDDLDSEELEVLGAYLADLARENFLSFFRGFWQARKQGK